MSAARILPREEWYRLPGDAVALYETMRPEDVSVVVVEDAGEIVARMGVLRIPHFESFWMAPDKIGNAGIARMLLRAAGKTAANWARSWILANASTEDDGVRQFLERVGSWMPVHTFMLQLGSDGARDECHPPSS